jgi:peroxiredoxin family protein
MPQADTPQRHSTFICSRGTLDGAYPPLILAVNTVRLGGAASVFYTFMGINILRPGCPAKLRFHPPGFLGAIPGMSLMATFMMRRKIEAAGIPDVPTLLETAQLEGVRLVACKMTMDMMGLGPSDLIDGISVMTAEEYIKLAEACQINMFT